MMEHSGYCGSAEYDEGTASFFGEVAGIRDVVTFQGGMEELEVAFRESVDDYLECSGS
jgi:predicted HicB family RNase H-like nuclease